MQTSSEDARTNISTVDPEDSPMDEGDGKKKRDFLMINIPKTVMDTVNLQTISTLASLFPGYKNVNIKLPEDIGKCMRLIFEKVGDMDTEMATSENEHGNKLALLDLLSRISNIPHTQFQTGSNALPIKAQNGKTKKRTRSAIKKDATKIPTPIGDPDTNQGENVTENGQKKSSHRAKKQTMDAQNVPIPTESKCIPPIQKMEGDLGKKRRATGGKGSSSNTENSSSTTGSQSSNSNKPVIHFCGLCGQCFHNPSTLGKHACPKYTKLKTSPTCVKGCKATINADGTFQLNSKSQIKKVSIESLRQTMEASAYLDYTRGQHKIYCRAFKKTYKGNVQILGQKLVFGTFKEARSFLASIAIEFNSLEEFEKYHSDWLMALERCDTRDTKNETHCLGCGSVFTGEDALVIHIWNCVKWSSLMCEFTRALIKIVFPRTAYNFIYASKSPKKKAKKNPPTYNEENDLDDDDDANKGTKGKTNKTRPKSKVNDNSKKKETKKRVEPKKGKTKQQEEEKQEQPIKHGKHDDNVKMKDAQGNIKKEEYGAKKNEPIKTEPKVTPGRRQTGGKTLARGTPLGERKQAAETNNVTNNITDGTNANTTDNEDDTTMVDINELKEASEDSNGNAPEMEEGDNNDPESKAVIQDSDNDQENEGVEDKNEDGSEGEKNNNDDDGEVISTPGDIEMEDATTPGNEQNVETEEEPNEEEGAKTDTDQEGENQNQDEEEKEKNEEDDHNDESDNEINSASEDSKESSSAYNTTSESDSDSDDDDDDKKSKRGSQSKSSSQKSKKSDRRSKDKTKEEYQDGFFDTSDDEDSQENVEKEKKKSKKKKSKKRASKKNLRDSEKSLLNSQENEEGEGKNDEPEDQEKNNDRNEPLESKENDNKHLTEEEEEERERLLQEQEQGEGEEEEEKKEGEGEQEENMDEGGAKEKEETKGGNEVPVSKKDNQESTAAKQKSNMDTKPSNKNDDVAQTITKEAITTTNNNNNPGKKNLTPMNTTSLPINEVLVTVPAQTPIISLSPHSPRNKVLPQNNPKVTDTTTNVNAIHEPKPSNNNTPINNTVQSTPQGANTTQSTIPKSQVNEPSQSTASTINSTIAPNANPTHQPTVTQSGATNQEVSSATQSKTENLKPSSARQKLNNLMNNKSVVTSNEAKISHPQAQPQSQDPKLLPNKGKTIPSHSRTNIGSSSSGNNPPLSTNNTTNNNNTTTSSSGSLKSTNFKSPVQANATNTKSNLLATPPTMANQKGISNTATTVTTNQPKPNTDQKMTNQQQKRPSTINPSYTNLGQTSSIIKPTTTTQPGTVTTNNTTTAATPKARSTLLTSLMTKPTTPTTNAGKKSPRGTVAEPNKSTPINLVQDSNQVNNTKSASTTPQKKKLGLGELLAKKNDNDDEDIDVEEN